MSRHSENEDVVQANYFACTLGEAANIKQQHPTDFRTVGGLIEFQALNHPEKYAVAFPDPDTKTGEWGSKLYTFRDLERASRMNEGDVGKLRDAYGEFQTIALLCPSSVEFLFTWLRLVRAGYSVLILAPQCSTDAIAHLCKYSNAPVLLYHKQLSEKALASSTICDGSPFKAVQIPWEVDVDPTSCNFTSPTPLFAHRSLEEDIAYIFHTSGTSSGLPKPIPQSHHAAVGVLPSLDGQNSATFTTTPLYHGGIADCFRAWSSQALIWLFPGENLPITSRNILQSLLTAKAAEKSYACPRVEYFSSVPYILEMLSEDQDGLKMLQEMDQVGVGGAALPRKLGDDLVEAGVNLLSRFGSAECGFLLSSHRKFGIDNHWQFLRVQHVSQHLRFEKQEDSGISELVVLKGWPHMSKVNREDGSFATSDLFEPHPDIKDAWRYHSRSDSQITLKTGKKFDPAPLEDEIRNASSQIVDVMIFGNDQQVPGLLVFPSSKCAESELLDHVWGVIQDINKRGQQHTRIAKHMIAFLPNTSDGFKKSSKGTILRKETESIFAKDISNLYPSGNEVQTSGAAQSQSSLSRDEIRRVVMETLKDSMAREEDLGVLDDFYHSGIDSSQSIRIRVQLEKKLHISLPWNVLYDCENTQKLLQYLIDQINRPSTGIAKDGEHRSETKHMHDLVDRFSVFNYTNNSKEASIAADDSSLVVLTGATGSLGVHILEILRRNLKVSQIICLVRAPNDKEARLRISNSLVKRNKQSLTNSKGRIVCVPSDFSKADLGITSALYEYIQQKATHIIHAAWAVNFSLSVNSYEVHFTGLQSLLTLGMSSSRETQIMFCSSTASVLGPKHPPKLQERISSNPQDCDSLGYSKSKWIAEAICNRASQETGMNQRIKILRIGQLTGDTAHGIWNTSEAWPLMLSTVDMLGCLPRLEQKLTWLPLDIAAHAVVDIAFATGEVGDHESCLVYHVLNNNTDTSWNNLLGWIQETGQRFEIVEMEEWLEKLDGIDNHPAKSLSGLWKRGSQSGEAAEVGITFDVNRAASASEPLQNVGAVDKGLVQKIWRWLRNEISLRRPIGS